MMNMSLRDIEIEGAPPLQCRGVLSSVTFAHIAGLPLTPDHDIDPVRMQKLDSRVSKHFGDVPHHVIPPELLPHESGVLAFPKVERMAFLLSEETSEALVLVWFEPEDEVFMSESNLTKLKQLNWANLARPVDMNR